MADLKLERQRLISPEDATAAQRAVATAAKASLLAVPRRAVLAGLPREHEDLVRRLIVEALRELARKETA